MAKLVAQKKSAAQQETHRTRPNRQTLKPLQSKHSLIVERDKMTLTHKTIADTSNKHRQDTFVTLHMSAVIF